MKIKRIASQDEIGNVFVYPLPSSDKAYYVHLQGKETGKHTLVIINKDISSYKEVPILIEPTDQFKKSFIVDDKFVLFLIRYKDKRAELIKATYNLNDGQKEKEETLSSVGTNAMGIKVIYAVSSDGNKHVFCIFAKNEENVYDRYCVDVLDSHLSIEQSNEFEMELSGNFFILGNAVVSNQGEVLISFFSQPQDMKLDSVSFVDVHYIKGTQQIVGYCSFVNLGIQSVMIKELHAGNVVVGVLLDDMTQNGTYPENIYMADIAIGNDRVDFLNDRTQPIPMVKRSAQGSNYTTNYELIIDRILEDTIKGKIVVVLEQNKLLYAVQNTGDYQYIEHRGSIISITFDYRFTVRKTQIVVKHQVGEGEVEELYDSKILGISYQAKIIDNKLCFIFNQAVAGTIEKDVFFASQNTPSSLVLLFNNDTSTTITDKKNRYMISLLDIKEDSLLVLTTDDTCLYVQKLAINQ